MMQAETPPFKPESATAGCHQSLVMFWRRQHEQSFDLSLSYGYVAEARYGCILLEHLTANASRRSGSLLRIGFERLSVDALFSTLSTGACRGWLYDKEP